MVINIANAKCVSSRIALKNALLTFAVLHFSSLRKFTFA